jgi:3-dehydroquinate synthase
MPITPQWSMKCCALWDNGKQMNRNKMPDSQNVADKVRVNLGSRSYDILVGEGLLSQAGALLLPLLKRKRVAIVTDENVAGFHLASLAAVLDANGVEHKSLVLTPGEASKSYAGLQQVCEFLLTSGIERNDVVVALGGGVIGDLAGFAAGVVRRGVRFVQIPTTLLAQVDSSVGGKTGINSPHGKNLIGVFHQPSLVLADLDLLKTLPMRERAAGYAEVAKYGLLGDAQFFDWLDQRIEEVIACDTDAVRKAVRRSCEMKAGIVAQDETETGVRALLNLGHTFGHALEAATGYSSRLLHGESVAIGMVQAFRFSGALGLCDPHLGDYVERHLKRAGLPTHLSAIPGEVPPSTRLLEIMHQDKKASGGKLVFILARAIGETFVARDIAEKDVLDFLEKDRRTS